MERFWSKVEKSEGCWLWIAATNDHGYGYISIDGRMVRAHVFAYEQEFGPVPDGMVLDHTCHTSDVSCEGGRSCVHRRCVRPSHLTPTTNRQNVLSGKTLAGDNARKTECSKGHPFNDENTYVAPDGSRKCRMCRRATSAKYRDKKQAA